MMKTLIFAGTTEGRTLAERLSANKKECIVCVATEYGNETMPDLPGVKKKVGRLDIAQMMELMRECGAQVVVDATHPFATIVSVNIRQACDQLNIRYIRLKRQTKASIDKERIYWFKESSSCAKALENTQGNILLTTGSKELALYCRNEALKKRLYVRVLPGHESIEICKQHGISNRNIIAMQGPFSKKLNEALIEQFEIKYLVTKESGKIGGLDEKILAADACHIDTFIIGCPDDSSGMTLEQVLGELGVETLTAVTQNESSTTIRLVGIGMGEPNTLTQEAKDAIEKADYLLGARRMIEPYNALIEKKEIYLADDIAEYIKDKKGYITILFSGDSGFYSGCRKVYERLRQEKYNDIKIIPGISSISYLSSRTGIPWSEAEIFSMHGREKTDKLMGALYETIIHSGSTFVLMSGLADVHQLAKLLEDDMTQNIKIILGRNLSYPDEEIEYLTPGQCITKNQEGLYTAVVLNSSPISYKVTNSHKDSEFIRAKVPMTKEEIRTVSISKLGLKTDSVVWDIGSGTGSIAVEIAGYSPKLEVYAIEQKKEAISLIKDNVTEFKVHNVRVIHGKAPEALCDLPAPSHVFIGGSSGELEEILEVIRSKNPKARVVINAVSLETIAQVTELSSKLKFANFEAVTLLVSRSKTLGSYNLMQAENPVTIFTFQLVH